jgi:peptidoglycan/xylan/chitin deacetylase (PgdA/CDA1 family)
MSTHSPNYGTSVVLDKLAAAGVKATFFINGANINTYSGPILARAFAEGHTIAHHGYTHTAVAGRVHWWNGSPTQDTVDFFEQMIWGTFNAACKYLVQRLCCCST